MSHPYKSSPQKMTHHVVAVGVFCGLIFFWSFKKTGWWFQTFVMSIPKIGEMIQFDEHIFQMGWFNHQLYRKELSQIFLHGSKTKEDSQLEDSQILSKLLFFTRCHEYVGAAASADAQRGTIFRIPRCQKVFHQRMVS